MTIRLIQAAMAVAVLTTMPSMVLAGQRSAADQALYQRAVKDCSSPRWADGARPHINYAGGWYRCVEPKRG
jgi:hypothetical protein